MTLEALSGEEYDSQWNRLEDFIKYNPGARHRRRIILSLIKDLSFSNIADIGCGLGELLIFLKENIKQKEISYTGLDFAEETLKKNKKSLPWAEFEYMDVTNAPINKKYDLIICSEVIEHIEDQKEAFKNIAKTVNPDGHLILTTPTGKIFETEKRFGHTNHLTQNELRKFGEENNLKLIKEINWGFPTYKIIKYLTNINTDWSISQFGSGHYTPTKKTINNLIYAANFFNFNSPLGCQLFYLFKKR